LRRTATATLDAPRLMRSQVLNMNNDTAETSHNYYFTASSLCTRKYIE
jgi:hypothetical protein